MIQIAFDTETSGLSYHKGARMFTFSTVKRGGVDADVQRLDWRGAKGLAARQRLEDIWSKTGARRYAKVMHNARFDIGHTQALLGRSLREDGHEIHETMSLSHIFQNQHYSHALDDVAYDIFGYPKDQDGGVSPYIQEGRGLLDCPEWKLTPYQIADAERTMMIFEHFFPKLAVNGWEEIYQMERDLVWTTLSIEDRGVMLSVKRSREMQNWLRQEATAALAEYRALSGDKGTPLGGGLAKTLQRMGFKLTKRTKSGSVSTDKFVMMELRESTRDPVIDAILKYRSYNRGVTTIEGYIENTDDADIIHPSIHPYRAKTSREAIKNPSMQNVGKEGTLLSAFPIPARKCFRPKPGYVNFHLDYKGIQARFLVHFSQDPEAIEIFRRDGDFHAEAALCWYGDRFARLVPGCEEWKTLRGAAKNADFAIGFGAGIKKIALSLGMSYAETERGHARFKRRFPGYADMARKFAAFVSEHGYVDTLFGRRLYLPRNKPYVGTNYVIQGSEAGVLKRAQIRVDEYLRRATGGEAGIILPIHDELIIEWPRARLDEARGCLRDIIALMVDFPQSSVPLEVDVKIGTRDWASLKGYEI